MRAQLILNINIKLGHNGTYTLYPDSGVCDKWYSPWARPDVGTTWGGGNFIVGKLFVPPL